MWRSLSYHNQFTSSYNMRREFKEGHWKKYWLIGAHALMFALCFTMLITALMLFARHVERRANAFLAAFDPIWLRRLIRSLWIGGVIFLAFELLRWMYSSLSYEAEFPIADFNTSLSILTSPQVRHWLMSALGMFPPFEPLKLAYGFQ